jgi:squalene cyclase
MSAILIDLGANNYPADPATDALARLIRLQQFPDGHWQPLAHRPPIEASDIQVTATAIHALKLYAPVAQKAEFEQTVKRAASWLGSAKPTDTQDRAMLLMGLGWSGATQSAIMSAVKALRADQRADGGWAQLTTLQSDAYATGQALVALGEAAGVASTDPAVAKGIKFLLSTQRADGSWYVQTRVIPLQPYFESNFPYGHDQWISAAATNWAAQALARAR